MEEGVLAIGAVFAEILVGRACYWTGYVLLKTITLGKAEISKPNPISNRYSVDQLETRGFSSLFARVLGFGFWLVAIGVIVAI